MTNQSNPWAVLIEAAETRVSAARQNERNAALDVVKHSAIALRGLVNNGELPDPERMVFLRALLDSLVEIERGVDPTLALHLRPDGRVRDENLAGRDLLLFVRVGQALDYLVRERGHTRSDGPTEEAQRQVARETGVSVALVKKTWTQLGASRAWAKMREFGWGDRPKSLTGKKG